MFKLWKLQIQSAWIHILNLPLTRWVTLGKVLNQNLSFRVASPRSMHDTGYLGLVHWDDPEGWYGEGGGRRVQDREHM